MGNRNFFNSLQKNFFFALMTIPPFLKEHYIHNIFISFFGAKGHRYHLNNTMLADYSCLG